tara:strand:+ start:530 stop:937 length:408 start_codon:yes stop_codon:yes gene_type:complete
MDNLTKMTKEQKAKMQRLFEKANVGANDVFTHAHFMIINRSGIEKLQYSNGIQVQYEAITNTEDFACVKATGKKGIQTIETFGSACTANTKGQGNYFAEMAEKRALSRVVLKILRLYEVGIFGEDENVQNNSTNH